METTFNSYKNVFLNIQDILTESLLQIEAVKLQPTQPFTWASGWQSPIYCDNRKTLSFPKVRTLISKGFLDIINKFFPQTELIAGVATGGIAHGVLVAQELNLPFVYVRSESKGHGLQNRIEGVFKDKQKTIVIEDLISTGGSSLSAVEALRQNNIEVLGLLAIFDYEFDIANQNFKTAKCPFTALSNYSTLIQKALDTKYIQENQLETLNQWRQNPSTWKAS